MRTWLKRLLVAILLLVGLHLVGVNLFLNTPLAPRAFNRRPEKFRMTWSSAWSPWPGYLRVRGLKLEGHTNHVLWTVAADRAQGWVALPGLLGRRLLIRELHAQGVRSTVRRGLEIPAPPPSPRPKPGARRGPSWTMRFEGVALEHVREFTFNNVRLTGDGRVDGAFGFTLGGPFRLEPSKVRMPGARLLLGDDVFARDLNLEGEAAMGPYKVREHPGLAGFDFLSGWLRAQGRVPDLPFLESAGIPGGPSNRLGSLTTDVRVKDGRFLPGSRLDLTAPANGPASPFVATAAITDGSEGPRLRIGIEAKGFTAGRRKGLPPVFRAASLSLASATPETRLSRVFATARDLRSSRKLPPSLPLASDARAEGVRIEAVGSIAMLHATVDRVAGTVDLAGLLTQEIDFSGLQADGITAQFDFEKPDAPPGPPPPPWSVRLAGARLTGIRAIGVDGFRLAGESTADATFSYERNGTLTVERAAFTLPAGTFQAQGQTVAEALSVKLETRIEPSILGKARGRELLKYVSGTAGLKARISSLGFLEDFFQKTPWLSLQGRGGLSADVRMDHGKLLAGSRLAVAASPVQARIFDSLATGRGSVSAAVDAKHTALRVRFDRFGLEDLRRKGRPDYLRGRGLQIAAAAGSPLDLTTPMADADATLDLPDAEVPDLAVYGALIPPETGLSILSGRGRVRLHLEASAATRQAHGSALVTSDTARVRFQNLEMAGRLALRAPIVSPDLDSRRFDLRGMRLELDDVTYRNMEEADGELTGWWANIELTGGSMVWGAPVSLRGEGKVDMKSSGPLLELFAQRSRFLRWFDDALNVENVTARGVVNIGNGALAIESLQATGGPLEVRSRMIFSKIRRWGDLFVRYGRLAAGIELRDGKRSLKLRRPLEWFESGSGAWPASKASP
ncbi:MAG: hypothetical protein ACJ75H_04365 [Thermoanaerobaculia bacterium]